ncbi:uncharacterized protein LOC120104614 [Phoenix dactylifera]|uniref:Uncharacterized protein LOC120104614 n=1 Tax=Phoenix dactylifera TaxID=42345 RepID=A0A8B8ZD02_PHODC|nr:uncharacterized protein LOC120104614 [Phoenix dactylifera]
MGAALAIALSLALVFTLLSVILADLLCSLLCRRKHRFERAAPNTSDAGAAAEAEEDPPTPPLSFPFYAHGVLQAPTTFLLTIPNLEAATAAAAAALPPKQVECKSRMVLTVEHESPSVPASPCIHRISSAAVDSAAPDHFVCISNPIYNGIGGGDDKGTPFETPDASPSHLGPDPEEETESDSSPQLTVMKKLPSVPPQALSAAGLMEGRRSLPTSASATETNRVSSSSSSYSLCCSPSW